MHDETDRITSQLPSWPAFPATVQEATQAHLNAIICQKPANDTECSHQGTEQGTEQTVTSTCYYGLRGNVPTMNPFGPQPIYRTFDRCEVTFTDDRPMMRFERGLFGTDVHGEDVDEDGDVTGGQNEDIGSTNSDGSEVEAASSGVCNLFGGGNFGDCLISILAKVGANIIWIFVQVLAVLLGLVGVIFNWVVLVTVFQFATYFGNSEGLLTAWSVLRDIGNILLLFGFIFIGLQTILNVGHFSVGKALPRLLIFALLINFSLLVSSAIIDTANIFSSALYSSMGGVNCAETGEEIPEECTGYGIAGRIQAAAGLGNIKDSAGGFGEIWSADDGVGMFTVYAGLLLLIIIMLIVLIAATIMLLFRALTLMVLMVLSPIGFAASAIPQFEEYSKMWWNKLLSQAFFAPVFLLMLFVGLKIMDGANETFNQNGASLTTAFASGDTNVGGIFIIFFLIIGFVVAALVSAAQLGAMGASFATRQAGNMVLGGAAKVGRHTIGRNMHAWAEARKSDPKYRSGMGKLLHGAVAAGGKASYDARGIGMVGAVAKAGHLDLGKSKTGGYTKIVHDEEKAHMDYAKNLKNSEEEKTRIEALNKSIKASKTAYATMTAEMRERHKSDKELVRALADVTKWESQAQAARARGTVDEKAELALSNSYKKRDDIVAAQRREQEEAKQAHEQEVKGYEADIKKIKEAPKREYAANIMKPPPLVPRAVFKRTVYGEAAEHGSHKILDDLDKDDQKRLLDALTGVNEGLNKPSHGPAPSGGKDDHASDH